MAYRRRGRGLRLLIILAVVILLLAFGFGLLFNVNEILVDGAYEYSAGQIIEASELKTGGNLFLVNTNAAEKRITEALPYVTFVTITRELPGTVRISVSEGIASAAIEFEGTLYLLDENCKVIKRADEDDNYIKIVGLEVTDVKRGQVVTVSKEDETRLAFTQAMLNRLGDDGYSANVTWLDVSNISSITFDYKGRFTVNVGSGDKLEYKLSRLDGVIEQIDENSTGVIDLSAEGKSYFNPS